MTKPFQIYIACFCALVVGVALVVRAQPLAFPNPNMLATSVGSRLQSNESQKDSFKPKEGYVPNAETAISIAVAVWIPIYGKDNIERQRPYRAGLKNGIWTVTGSLPKGKAGGVAVAEISKDDGRILRVIHYK
jgi:hypothetical protein